MSTPREWNPYYLAYSTAHGRNPDAQLAHDVVRWPGGKMCGFILWMHARWEEWRAATMTLDYALTPAQRDAFGTWLEQYAVTAAATVTDGA